MFQTLCVFRPRNVGRLSCEPLFRLAAGRAAHCLPPMSCLQRVATCKQCVAAPVLFDRAASAAGAVRRLDSCWQKLCGERSVVVLMVLYASNRPAVFWPKARISDTQLLLTRRTDCPKRDACWRTPRYTTRYERVWRARSERAGPEVIEFHAGRANWHRGRAKGESAGRTAPRALLLLNERCPTRGPCFLCFLRSRRQAATQSAWHHVIK